MSPFHYTARSKDRCSSILLLHGCPEAGQNYSQNQSKQIPFPFHRPLTPDGPILKLSSKLLVEVLAPNSGSASSGKKPVINIINLSLGFSGLERGEEGQKGIEGFFKPKIKTEGELSGAVVKKEESSVEEAGREKRKREDEDQAEKRDLKGKGRKKTGIGSYFLPVNTATPSTSTSTTRPDISRSSSSSTTDHSPSILSPAKKKTKMATTKPVRNSSTDTYTTDTTPISLLSDDDVDDTPTPKRPSTSASASIAKQSPAAQLSFHTRPAINHHSSSTASSSSNSTSVLPPPTSSTTSKKPKPSLPSSSYWTCPKCPTRFLLSSSLPPSSSSSHASGTKDLAKAQVEERAGRELVDERVRTEHLDHHLAMELQEETVAGGSGSGNGRGGVASSARRGGKAGSSRGGGRSGDGAGGKVKNGKKSQRGAAGGLGDWLVRKKS